MCPLMPLGASAICNASPLSLEYGGSPGSIGPDFSRVAFNSALGRVAWVSAMLKPTLARLVWPPSLFAKAPLNYLGRACPRKKELTLQTTLRGLELIKSCAKFYANGVGMAKPTVQLSHRSGAA